MRDQFELFQLDSNDLILDPIARDTDGDGINDATEVAGFRTFSIVDEIFKRYETNPLTPFSDSDTFTDGFEKLLGLDPLSGTETDEDGDRLPDIIETRGWQVGNLSSALTITLTRPPLSLPNVKLQYGPGESSKDNTITINFETTADQLQLDLNNLQNLKSDGATVSVIHQDKFVFPQPTRTFTVTFGGTPTYAEPLTAVSSDAVVKTIRPWDAISSR